jgi:hypothetical protein
MTRALFLVFLLALPCSAQGALDRAKAQVRHAGYTVVDTRGFTDGLALQVLVGQDARSGDGYAKKAFFFYKGRYLGTDTSDASALEEVSWQDSDTVAVLYILYRSQDPMCCPTGGGAIVRYHWTGSRLTPLDPIPSSSAGSSLSRR